MKINNQRFSIRFCRIMDGLGITTVKQAERFLKRCTPTMKLLDTRVAHLRKEMEAFLVEGKV